MVRGNFENQECRRSHLRSFCNAIKVSNLPELCLLADVSEEKVPIYSMFLILNVEIWSRNNSTTILSLPLIQELLAKECALRTGKLPRSDYVMADMHRITSACVDPGCR